MLLHHITREVSLRILLYRSLHVPLSLLDGMLCCEWQAAPGFAAACAHSQVLSSATRSARDIHRRLQLSFHEF